jgi:prephenate dehydrogenase
MSKPVVTIIGLGLTGAGLGLALQRQEATFEVVGHDKAPDVAQAAKRVGAVQRTEWNLHRAVEPAELVLVAVPLSELEELFGQIAEDLREGCLVLALTSLLQPSLTLAAKHLPARAHFVAGHPILNGIGGELTLRADLFEQVVFALAAGAKTEAAGVQLASDLVDRVGATPLFVDALEHDGIMAGVEQLPQIMAAALMQLSAAGAGWREARRLAGRYFATGSSFGENPAGLAYAARANRENLLLRIRQMQQALGEWAERVAALPDEKTPDALLAALEEAAESRATWEADAATKNWEEQTERPPRVEAAGFFRQMFFGNLGGKRRQ